MCTCHAGTAKAACSLLSKEPKIELLLKRTPPRPDVTQNQIGSAELIDLWSLRYNSNDAIIVLMASLLL